MSRLEDVKPGTIALATVRRVENIRVARIDYHTTPPWMSLDAHPEGKIWHGERHVSNIRPLVIIDFSVGGPYLAQNVIAAIRHACTVPQTAMNKIAQQIEEQTDPPKPPEPNLSHVIDTDGNEWARRKDGLWVCLGGANSLDAHGPGVVRSYENVRAVRVVSATMLSDG